MVNILVLEVLATEIRQEKAIRSIRIEEERGKIMFSCR